MAQMKEQIKIPEKKAKQQGDRQPIWCRVENTGNQDVTWLIELSRKMKEEMEATQSEIKQNIQGINSEGQETGTQINDLEQREEINIQPEQNDETRIQ